MQNTLLKLSVSLSVVMFAVVGQHSLAESLDSSAMCDKIKSCAMQSINEQEMPDEIKEMLISQLDSQCTTAFESKKQEIEDAGLTKHANRCGDSMVELSCQELMTPNGAHNTQACQDFKEAADKAGIEVN